MTATRCQPLVRTLGVAAISLALIALTACAPSTKVPIVPFAERATDELSLGDCFSVPDVEALDLVPDERIPCDEPHNVEVVGLLAQFDGEPLPEAGQIDPTMFPPCFDAIKAGVLGPVEELPLYASYEGSLADDGTIDGPVSCLLITSNGPIATGSVFTSPSHELVGDYRLAQLLERGTCFTIEKQVTLALVSECESGVLMFLGGVEAEGGDEFPGEDEMRSQRAEVCPPLVPDDDDRIDPDSWSGNLPGLSAWGLGARIITCDVEVK